MGLPPDFKARVTQLEMERADQLHQAFWVNALKGDKDAAKVCLQVAEHRARLLGLYPPQMREQPLENQHRSTSTDRIERVLEELEQMSKTIDGEAEDIS